MGNRAKATLFLSGLLAIAACRYQPETLPGWEELDDRQSAVERAEFVRLMDRLYAPNGHWRDWMRLRSDGVWIRQSAENPEAAYWYAFGAPDPLDLPPAAAEVRAEGLRGLRVAIDPGHIGGPWGKMEERSFSVGSGPVVQEGDLVLAAAGRLKALLEERGAEVWLTRDDAEPVTPLRPKDFLEAAEERLALPADSPEVRRLAERLFYRHAEIAERARILNAEFQPDLAIALHINAAAMPDPENPTLVEVNTGHVLVHGAYLPSELADDAMRLELWLRLTAGYHKVEIPLAMSLASAMEEATGLPPHHYAGDNALKIDDEGYVWARNLMANRLYRCPVVYLEPWILNSESVYPWAALGDYEGERLVDGRPRPSLPSVYARFVLEGLLRYYGSQGGSD